VKRHGLTRREMLGRGGIAVIGAGGLTLAGIGGYAWPHDSAAAASIPTVPASPDDARGVLHFVSRPDLAPPALTIAHYDRTGSASASAPPYIILAPAGYPRTGPGEPGLAILNRKGDLVWYAPNTGFPASAGAGRMDLKVQSYRGQPVLTWWEGRVIAGYGEGQAVIADSSYRTIATVNAGHGLRADLHEFVITPQDTALITAFRPMAADLSALGGPRQGTVLSGTVQEIDIASGQVLFQWDSLDHVPVTDTFVPFAGGTKAAPFDYFHINSIAIAPDGDLLISARNTSTIYKLARPSGAVQWRLGGKRSSLLAANQGSMQVLADGRVLVGWGNLPYFSEFSADGTLIVDGQFPVGDQSYRTFAADWTGHPTDKPAVAARVNPAGGSVVYVSWNGATELDTWTVFAGQTANALKKAGSQRHSGFETMITVNSAGPYFAVTAVDASGHPLGRSATVRIQP
jgi:Arylsulfotransferase (ASST)